MPPNVDGFDVSKWQDPRKWDWGVVRDLNAELLATTGRRLIMVARATYGARTLDAAFPKYAELIRASGAVFGAYHFYRQTHSVEDQMRAWEKAMQSIGDLQPGELLPVLDMEDNAVNGDGRVNKAIWNRACDEIGDAWKARYGGAVLYYSAFFPDMLDAYKKNTEWEWMKEGGYFHWLADYTAQPGKPRHPYTPEWHLHQSKPHPHAAYAHGTADVDCDYAAPDLDLDTMLVRDLTKPVDSGAPEVPLEHDPFEDIYDGLAIVRAGVQELKKRCGM